jgi:hypothetical protein
MIRIALTLLLLLGSRVSLPGQSADPPGRSDEGERPVAAGAANPADSVLLPDTATGDLDAEEPGTRAVGGAIVGAVTGAVLSAQGSDCAPAGSAGSSSFIGAFWGALRAALRWDNTDRRPLQGDVDGGEEGPYPFEGQNCRAADRE